LAAAIRLCLIRIPPCRRIRPCPIAIPTFAKIRRLFAATALIIDSQQDNHKMKFQKALSLSPAGARLKEAQAAITAAQADMASVQAVISRLETAARAPAPIAAELAMLDKDESAEMAQWAANPNGKPAPEPRQAGRRADLQRRLEAAEAQARAAAGAMAAPRAALNAAGQKAAAAQRQAWIANKLVEVEKATTTLEPLKASIAAIYAAKRRVDAAREGVLAGLTPGSDTGEVYMALSSFDKRRLEAEAIPMSEIKAPDGIAPDAQHDLARALAQLGPTGPWLDVGAPPMPR
jgi:hypothetical protein